MTITIGVGPVNAVSSTEDDNESVVLSGVTAGRTLVVCVFWYHATHTLTSISCTGESDLELQPRSFRSTTSRSVQWGILSNVTAGGDKTLTATFSSGTGNFHKGIVALELVGANVADAFDAIQNADGNSTNPSTSITTTFDNSALVAVVSTDTNADPTVGSGFTLIDIGETIGFVEGEYNLDAGAAGSKTVDFVANSGNWALSAMAVTVQQPDIILLPILTLNGFGFELGLREDLPLLTLNGEGAGGAGIATFNLPAGFIFSSEGSGGSIGTGATFNLPVLDVLAPAPGFGNSIVPLLLPMLTLSATGQTGNAAVAAFALPMLTLEIAGHENGLGAAAPILPVLRLFAQGATGHVGSSVFALPILNLAGSGLQNGLANAGFNLPVLFLSAQGELSLAAGYRTWVLNARKGALTEYDNFLFNSYALFNGQVLACGPGGVVTLGTQALDGTLPINASWRGGMNDFDSSVHKRVPRIYHDGSQAGDIQFKAITIEGGTRTYLLPWNNISGHTQRRVPVGKGPRSRFWQFGVDNVAGSDFSTSSLMVYPQKLRRRIS